MSYTACRACLWLPGLNEFHKFTQRNTILNIVWHQLPDFWAQIFYGLQTRMNSFMFSLLNWLQGDLTTRYPSRYTHDILSWPESWFCMLMKYSFRKIWLKPCNESFRQAHGFWIFLKRTSWVIVRNGFWRSISF